MKEEMLIEAKIVDMNGEFHDWQARLVKHYSTPKSLNFKGALMGMAERQTYVCRSSRDVALWWMILDSVDRQNQFRNLTNLIRDTKVDYSDFMKFIKRGIEAGAWKRIRRGEYVVNPYMFKGKGVTLNTIIELQKEHPTWPVVRDGKVYTD